MSLPTEIASAIRAHDDDLDSLRAWLTAGGDANARGEDDAPAIVVAVSAGNRDAVSMLIEAGATPDVAAEHGSALGIAVARDDLALAGLLTEAGADPDQRDLDGLTPLMHARGAEQVAWLLERGAKLDLQDDGGATALHCAAGRDDAEAIRALLAAGANALLRDTAGLTALAFAEAEGRSRAVAALDASAGGDDPACVGRAIVPEEIAGVASLSPPLAIASRGAWKRFLRRWNERMLEGVAFDDVSGLGDAILCEAVEAGDCTRHGAAPGQLAGLEARLGRPLPASFRSFLGVSNGLAAPPYGTRLLGIDEIDWFRHRSSGWIDAWRRTHAEADTAPHDYFRYAAAPEAGAPRSDDLAAALQIGTAVEGCVYLLNPQVQTPCGEWEAWEFGDAIGGARRFRSFADLMDEALANAEG